MKRLLSLLCAGLTGCGYFHHDPKAGSAVVPRPSDAAPPTALQEPVGVTPK